MTSEVRDLAAELFSRLRRRSVNHAERFETMFVRQHPAWQLGTLPPLGEQMRAMNEFWRVQLGLLQQDTLHARSCIMDNLEVEDWLRNFEGHILDVVLHQPSIPNYQWPQLTA